MSALRVAVIGGGSTYTPELVSGLARERERIEIGELVLHDIDAERREVVGGLARRMLDRQGFAGRLEVTGELDRALDGADVVLIQIRVGGQGARYSDETVPLPCGCIGQETTGAGGFAKAMRTVPVMLEIAARARELAGAGSLDRRLHQPGRDRHPGAARCRSSGGRAVQRRDRLPALAAPSCSGVEPERLVVDQVGLNHLTWVRAVRLDGEDVLAAAAGRARRAGAPSSARCRVELPASSAPCPRTTCTTSTSTTRCSPSSGTGTPRAEVVAGIERELLELYRDPALVSKPALLEQRGGAFYSEAATALVGSLFADAGDVQVVDVRNGGTLAGLADDDVVEVPARIGAAGRSRSRRRRWRRSCSGWSSTSPPTSDSPPRRRSARDPRTARLALLAHPLIGQWGLSGELLDRLAAAEASRVPLPAPEGVRR